MFSAGPNYRSPISELDINGMYRVEIQAAAARELYSGLIRIHILYHACHDDVFGFGMIEELARHGYKLSPGTLYPMLHSLEKKGLLQSAKVRSGSRIRRLYRATKAGENALEVAKEKVKELLGELLESA